MHQLVVQVPTAFYLLAIGNCPQIERAGAADAVGHGERCGQRGDNHYVDGVRIAFATRFWIVGGDVIGMIALGEVFCRECAAITLTDDISHVIIPAADGSLGGNGGQHGLPRCAERGAVGHGSVRPGVDGYRDGSQRRLATVKVGGHIDDGSFTNAEQRANVALYNQVAALRIVIPSVGKVAARDRQGYILIAAVGRIVNDRLFGHGLD